MHPLTEEAAWELRSPLSVQVPERRTRRDGKLLNNQPLFLARSCSARQAYVCLQPTRTNMELLCLVGAANTPWPGSDSQPLKLVLFCHQDLVAKGRP